ncbi:MAG: hypothetical protein NTV51_10510 [Verrucomicrobia bacterium]|nr:hypothetical protein [Verrucomicrobiota bacterium]
MHLELRPAIAGLAPKVPFMAFVGVGEKVILAYVPAKLTVAEAEPIFGAFPDLPVLVCDAEEFFVSDQTWNRIVESKRPVESLTKVPLPSPTGPAVALPSPRRRKNPPKAHGRSHRC